MELTDTKFTCLCGDEMFVKEAQIGREYYKCPNNKFQEPNDGETKGSYEGGCTTFIWADELAEKCDCNLPWNIYKKSSSVMCRNRKCQPWNFQKFRATNDKNAPFWEYHKLTKKWKQWNNNKRPRTDSSAETSATEVPTSSRSRKNKTENASVKK